jgi:RNA-directed DNA polymerase
VRSLRAWEALISPLNLWRAWEDFARGKRRRRAVAAFSLEADRHVFALARALREGSWRPGPYRLLRIAEPKRRLVSAAPVLDRVVHHAVYRVLAPPLNRGFLPQSYACLEGRGAHRALLRYQGELRRWRYVVTLDIERYFYSIERERLRGLLERRLREAPLRALIGCILDSGEGLYQRPDVVQWLGWAGPGAPGRGLPIGNLTSQWWGNLYLDGLDHFVKRDLRIPSYQRYMDDFTLFGDDAGRLRGARDEIAAWLWSERGLRLKDAQARPARTDRAQRYLGYRVTRGGFWPGPKMRSRIHGQLVAAASSPVSLRQSLASLGACWMF